MLGEIIPYRNTLWGNAQNQIFNQILPKAFQPFPP